jgi:hypothetical protein
MEILAIILATSLVVICVATAVLMVLWCIEFIQEMFF